MDDGLLIQIVAQLAFAMILVVTMRNAIRNPYPANLHIALFFGALASVVILSWAPPILGLSPPGWVSEVGQVLLVSLPYLLLRIVSDFSDVPRWLIRFAEVGLLLSAAAVLLMDPLPPAAIVGVITWFVGLHLYAALKFLRAAGRAHGVTRRRMQSAAVGTAFFGWALLMAGTWAVVGPPVAGADLALQLAILGSALAYLVGFAPPAFLRRAWREPGLRAFLHRVVELPWLEDAASTVRGIEEGAAAAFGADRATISLWDREAGVLRLPTAPPDAPGAETLPGQFIGGRAFRERRAIFTPHAAKDDPDNAEAYEAWNARAIVAAPMIAGGEPLGVLAVFGSRTPIFASDDLGLVQLLADQAAIILKNRRLLEEAAEVRAREDATRIRNDFLSAAAHDLRTPLQSIMGSAQVLEFKAAARPGEPVDLPVLQRISRESRRLSDFVTRLLDAGRDGRDALGVEGEPVQLDEVARRVCEWHSTDLHPCRVEADEPCVAEADPLRIEQLVENLVVNAKKYSPDGGEVTIRVWSEGSLARFSVRDRGIGISPADRPHLFERFRRGGNVDDRRFSGMGLGLYICRTIVEQHGGRIWIDSTPGEGSTFHVELPLTPHSSGKPA